MFGEMYEHMSGVSLEACFERIKLEVDKVCSEAFRPIVRVIILNAILYSFIKKSHLEYYIEI